MGQSALELGHSFPKPNFHLILNQYVLCIYIYIHVGYTSTYTTQRLWYSCMCINNGFIKLCMIYDYV